MLLDLQQLNGELSVPKIRRLSKLRCKVIISLNKNISLDKGKFMKEVRRLTHKTAALDDDNGGVVKPKKPLTAYMLFVREVK